jgi:hypothetical protein
MKYVKKLTDLLIKLSIQNAKAKAKRRGVKFNKVKFIKRQESALPVMYWYGLMWLCAVTLPEHILRMIPSELPVGIFFLLAIWGFNNYFSWVKIK